jgi:hypothetical protein
VTLPSLTPRRVLSGVIGPLSPEWSPDGQWLAFGGEIDTVRGTWLYDFVNSDLWRLTGSQGSVAWDPSGMRLAILADPGLGTPDSPHQAKLHIFGLRKLLQGPGR